MIKGVRYRISGATPKSTTGNAAAAGSLAPWAQRHGHQYSVALTVTSRATRPVTAPTAGTQTRVLTITY